MLNQIGARYETWECTARFGTSDSFRQERFGDEMLASNRVACERSGSVGKLCQHQANDTRQFIEAQLS